MIFIKKNIEKLIIENEYEKVFINKDIIIEKLYRNINLTIEEYNGIEKLNESDIAHYKYINISKKLKDNGFEQKLRDFVDVRAKKLSKEEQFKILADKGFEELQKLMNNDEEVINIEGITASKNDSLYYKPLLYQKENSNSINKYYPRI